MNIDDNEIQKEAMRAFHAGDRELGFKLQDDFVAAFHSHYDGKDHCSCAKPCKFHGKCVECVAIHRAHREHLPNCFQSMVNEKLKAVSGLTEHSIVTAITGE